LNQLTYFSSAGLRCHEFHPPQRHSYRVLEESIVGMNESHAVDLGPTKLVHYEKRYYATLDSR
jgi:hypothetical protein